ncbi:uncharacterized protein LOC114723428 [Neltuma alba]|uniref:uncharacterized protein LOC114723428 n=1 Tax=Neltuma alba TaxID=207710 RepID=UPI0010A51528|nr:uncharacterized protein LOC114723428 [Prosopis alba]
MGDHPQHPHSLRLNREETNTFNCSGCKEQGFGPRYECAKKNCRAKYILHKECFEAHPKDRFRTHPVMGDRGFKFLWTAPVGPNNRRLCHACVGNVHGFLYRARSNASWLYLHPSCMNLGSTISHPYKKMELNLRNEAPSNSQCVNCKRQDLNVGGGWSYVSSCGNYWYHVDCLKKLILEIRERGYFNVGSPSSSSSSSSSPSSSTISTTSSSSRIKRVPSDGGLTTPAASSVALPNGPWWRPRISTTNREELIKLVKIFVCFIIAYRLVPEDPVPVFNALADRVL